MACDKTQYLKKENWGSMEIQMFYRGFIISSICVSTNVPRLIISNLITNVLKWAFSWKMLRKLPKILDFQRIFHRITSPLQVPLKKVNLLAPLCHKRAVNE